jgi:hypothetical protein
MYPLTIGLAIENRDLWEQTQACLSELPFRIIVEHQDIGDVSNFLDRLERMRPLERQALLGLIESTWLTRRQV